MVDASVFGQSITGYAEIIGVKITPLHIKAYYEALKHLPHIVTVMNKAMTDRVYKNGEMLRLPTIPELKEYYRQLDGVLFGDDDNNYYRLESPKKPDLQATANNHLMMYLVSHFNCCPDKVIDLIDKGKLNASLDLVSKNIFTECWSQSDAVKVKISRIASLYKEIINQCKKDTNQK
jgi:hypothetical protein